MKVLITDQFAEEGVELLKGTAEVDILPDLSRSQLLETIGPYDGLIVRSATKVDEELLEHATNLKVVGRAGVGVDNVDVEAATRRGIVVVNAPGANNLSNAEHGMALMLSLVRHIPAAHESLRAGKWEKSRFTGTELQGKTLGLVGLGRTGILVAQRASPFGMRIIAADPYVTKARAAQLGIELVSHDALYQRADFISVHVHRTPETEGMIGEREFSLMKPTVRIINTARGGIIRQEALIRALKEGAIGGAALDVFDEEAPPSKELLELDNIVVTPHIGGSTEEAQRKAGESIAEQVLIALRGELAPYAVNVQAGAEFVEALRPFISLTEKLGRILTGLSAASGGGIGGLSFEFQGTLAEHDTRILTLAGLKGLLGTIVQEPVTYVNAPIIAKDRGIEVRESKTVTSPDYVNLVLMTAETDEGPIRVGGTLMGKRDQERIVRVYEFDIDLEPAQYMCFIRYIERPGIIGKVGTVLGEAGINIAGFDSDRESIGGPAVIALTVDSPMPAEVLNGITEAIEAQDVKFIDLGS